MMKKLKILITGVGGDIGQSVVRCLRESSYKIYLIGTDIDPYAAGRIKVDKFFQSVKAEQSEEYLNILSDLIRKERTDYIIPTTEAEIKTFNLYRNHFIKGSTNILINNPLIVETFSDKLKTSHFFEQNNMLYPKTYSISEFNGEIPFPLIVKKREGCGSKGLAEVEDKHALLYFKRKYQDAIVQQIIGNEDEEYTTGVFSDGNRVFSIAFRRYLGYGSLTKYAELVVDRGLSDLAQRTAKACGLKGSINIQCRKTKSGFKDGRLGSYAQLQFSLQALPRLE